MTTPFIPSAFDNRIQTLQDMITFLQGQPVNTQNQKFIACFQALLQEVIMLHDVVRAIAPSYLQTRID